MSTRGSDSGESSEEEHDILMEPLRAPLSETDLQCLAALRGEKVPSNDVLRPPLVRMSIVHGIRHHQKFAESPDVLALCSMEQYPEFARALHARLIMSNIIPDISLPDHTPYCIWYPDVATEETYRELVMRYPCMRYQVGRACAVAGYTTLYRDLDVLPDVCIAEEARDSGELGAEIFADIMGRPFRYAVMNDYARSTDTASPLAGAPLNGDTAVCSSLRARTNLQEYFKGSRYFDICEDGLLDAEPSVHSGPPALSGDEMALLYTQLPAELPTTTKDVLILMAAYEGNIDLYARLRRLGHPLQYEGFCLVRGIYHSTTFALWQWADITDRTGPPHHRTVELADLRQAMHARFIMSNDLSHLAPEVPDLELPYLIWYPHHPRESTLAELVRRRPAMRSAATHAAIVADYQYLYDRIAPEEPDRVLWRAAQLVGNGHYRADQERRAAERGVDVAKCGGPMNIMIDETVQVDMEPTTVWLEVELKPDHMMMWGGATGGPYGGFQPTSSVVDLCLCVPKKLRRKAAKKRGHIMQLYTE